MIFFNCVTQRPINVSELISRYGTNQAIHQLGICELAYQPTFTPISYRLLADGKYLPVQGYVAAEVANLIAAGYTPEEATAMITD